MHQGSITGIILISSCFIALITIGVILAVINDNGSNRCKIDIVPASSTCNIPPPLCEPCNPCSCNNVPVPPSVKYNQIYHDQNSNFTWGSSTAITSNGYLFIAQENVLGGPTDLTGKSTVFVYKWDSQYVPETQFEVNGSNPEIKASFGNGVTYLNVMTNYQTNSIYQSEYNFYSKPYNSNWTSPVTQIFTGTVEDFSLVEDISAVCTSGICYLLGGGTIIKNIEGYGALSCTLTKGSTRVYLAIGTTGAVNVFVDPSTNNCPYKTLYGPTDSYGAMVESNYPRLVVSENQTQRVNVYDYTNLDYSMGVICYPPNGNQIPEITGISMNTSSICLYNNYQAQAYEPFNGCTINQIFTWYLPNSVWVYVSGSENNFVISNNDARMSQLTVQQRCVC